MQLKAIPKTLQRIHRGVANVGPGTKEALNSIPNGLKERSAKLESKQHIACHV